MWRLPVLRALSAMWRQCDIQTVCRQAMFSERDLIYHCSVAKSAIKCLGHDFTPDGQSHGCPLKPKETSLCLVGVGVGVNHQHKQKPPKNSTLLRLELIGLLSPESQSWLCCLQWDKRTNTVKQLICKSSVTQVSCVARHLLIIVNENTGHQVWDI